MGRDCDVVIMTARFAIPVLAILCATSPLAAEAGPGRYQLERAGDGFLRLDRDTGAITFCQGQGGVWSCTAVRGGEAAAVGANASTEDQDAAMEHRLQAIEKRLAELEAQSKIVLPSDEDVDRALDIFGKFMNRFADFARDLNDRTRGQSN